MKLTCIFLLAAFLQVSADSRGQTVTLRLKGAPVKSMFRAIQQQTGLNIFVADAVRLEELGRVSLNVRDMPVADVLRQCFEGKPMEFRIDENGILIRARTIVELATPVSDTLITVRGNVRDQKGDPVPGASVSVRGQRSGVISDGEGNFDIKAAAGTEVQVSSIGYKPAVLTVRTSGNLVFVLSPATESLKDVVITGILTRRKESFTGAVASFTGEELKMVNNQNVISSLRTLDPSFLLMENNLKGSNPNVLPTIQLRGQTSISTDQLRGEFNADTNQPLFILDGFETTLRQVIDLDINRIASITILKDAASTAIYGSRASNGVVVIETLRPESGKTTLNYTTDATFELPELSGYNMMNSEEVLEFQRLAGRFKSSYWPSQIPLYDSLYNVLLRNVKSGVNTYWLNKPLRTGVTQRHSIGVSGGSGNLAYTATGEYRNVEGVMIGNGRKNWSGRLNLMYRTKKVTISNNLFVDGYKSEESPYGSFSTWVNTLPYYPFKSKDEKYLMPRVTGSDRYAISNPLYNASLNSYDRTKNFGITNNLQLRYDVSRDLNVTGGLQLRSVSQEQAAFISPLNTRFDDVSFLRKGTLDSRDRNTFSYTANLATAYVKMIGRSTLTGNLRTEVNETRNTSEGFEVEGFPSNSNGSARFAFGYKENGRPYSFTNIVRRNSMLASVNYSYDTRFNVDASATYDGSTVFGKKNMYSPFYSIGVGWNMEREKFIQQIPWINMLRIKANLGVTGNQNFDGSANFTSYSYLPNYNQLGAGMTLETLGNESLQWQNTDQYSGILEGAFFGNRLNIQGNIYRKITDPLVVLVDIPSSTGLSGLAMNAGSLEVKGVEWNVRYSPIYRPKSNIVWSLNLTGAYNTMRYDKFDARLRTLNEKMQSNRQLERYYDGADPGAIWAVRSAGIDPATGNELFIRRDGSLSYQFDRREEVIVGNSRPQVQGVFGSSLMLKRLSFNFAFRYLYGQDIFNSALFEKVENIDSWEMSTKNQDRRALYERWKKVGEVARYRSLQLDTETYPTYMSSRFVQRENTLSLESVNLTYDFRDMAWMQTLRLSNLRLSAYMNEILRFSTIRRERGLEYPYSKSFSLSLSANFK